MAEKRNGATPKLYIIREEFKVGLSTIYMYEQGKVCFPGYWTFNLTWLQKELTEFTCASSRRKQKINLQNHVCIHSADFLMGDKA